MVTTSRPVSGPSLLQGNDHDGTLPVRAIWRKRADHQLSTARPLRGKQAASGGAYKRSTGTHDEALPGVPLSAQQRELSGLPMWPIRSNSQQCACVRTVTVRLVRSRRS